MNTHYTFSEKKDLVELVMRENGGIPTSSSSASATPSFASTHAPFAARGPVERQRSFPKSYTESTHRSEWLEKFESGRARENDGEDAAGEPGNETSSDSTGDLVEGFVVVPSPDREATPSSTTEEASEAVGEDTPVEPMHEVAEGEEASDVVSASEELREAERAAREETRSEGASVAGDSSGGAPSLRPNTVEDVVGFPVSLNELQIALLSSLLVFFGKEVCW